MIKIFNDYGLIWASGVIGLLIGHAYGDKLEHTLIGMSLGLVIGFLIHWGLNHSKWIRIIILGLAAGILSYELIYEWLFPVDKPYLSIAATIITAVLSIFIFYSSEKKAVEEEK